MNGNHFQAMYDFLASKATRGTLIKLCNFVKIKDEFRGVVELAYVVRVRLVNPVDDMQRLELTGLDEWDGVQGKRLSQPGVVISILNDDSYPDDPLPIAISPEHAANIMEMLLPLEGETPSSKIPGYPVVGALGVLACHFNKESFQVHQTGSIGTPNRDLNELFPQLIELVDLVLSNDHGAITDLSTDNSRSTYGCLAAWRQQWEDPEVASASFTAPTASGETPSSHRPPNTAKR